MIGNQEKKGFLSKLRRVILGEPSEASINEVERGKYSPKALEPIDVRFVEMFTKSGGLFIYCQDNKELNENIERVCTEENITFVYSCEEEIKNILSTVDVMISQDASRSNAICSTCEALVAYNGGVMINEWQTGGIRLGDLPDVHIVIGRTSQIVENLHAGMAIINNKYRDKRPSQNTTLKGAGDKSNPLASNDLNANRVLYLLLLEDVLK